jgi:hypothetical protein
LVALVWIAGAIVGGIDARAYVTNESWWNPAVLGYDGAVTAVATVLIVGIDRGVRRRKIR